MPELYITSIFVNLEFEGVTILTANLRRVWHTKQRLKYSSQDVTPTHTVTFWRRSGKECQFGATLKHAFPFGGSFFHGCYIRIKNNGKKSNMDCVSHPKLLIHSSISELFRDRGVHGSRELCVAPWGKGVGGESSRATGGDRCCAVQFVGFTSSLLCHVRCAFCSAIPVGKTNVRN